MTGDTRTPRHRWEFRIFGETLAEERGALERTASAARAQAPRQDIYLVPPRGPEAALKIRGAKRGCAFDLKIMETRRGGLELWRAAGKAPPPLAAAELRRRFLEPAGLAADLPEGPVGAGQAGAACVARGAAAIAVRKRRRRLRLDDARAEIAELEAGGARLFTIAVECRDAAALHAALARLAFDPERNESYLARLRRLAFPVA